MSPRVDSNNRFKYQQTILFIASKIFESSQKLNLVEDYDEEESDEEEALSVCIAVQRMELCLMVKSFIFG